MIITIGLPFYLHFESKSGTEFIKFAISSFLFLNQLPILHILPTFIPLFIISPLILVMLCRNWDYLLIFLSIIFFFVGCDNPYIFNFGEKTIFPVVLWQIYFVLGSIVGKSSRNGRKLNRNRLLFYAVVLYAFGFLLKYGGYFDLIDNIKSTYEVYPKKFPLNLYGLLYGSSLLFLLYAIIYRIWGRPNRYSLFAEIIPLLGRNSLLTFVVHVYFVYLIESLAIFGLNTYLICTSIILSLYFTYAIIYQIEKHITTNAIPSTYKVLFS